MPSRMTATGAAARRNRSGVRVLTRKNTASAARPRITMIPRITGSARWNGMGSAMIFLFLTWPVLFLNTIGTVCSSDDIDISRGPRLKKSGFDTAFRFAAARALGTNGAVQAAEYQVVLLSDRNAGVRYSAVEVLGNIESEKAADALQQIGEPSEASAAELTP